MNNLSVFTVHNFNPNESQTDDMTANNSSEDATSAIPRRAHHTDPGSSSRTPPSDPGSFRESQSSQPRSSTETQHTLPGSSTETQHTLPESSVETQHTLPGSSSETQHTLPGSSRETQHSQPNWLEIFKRNFSTEIIEKCSEKTKDAVKNDKKIMV